MKSPGAFSSEQWYDQKYNPCSCVLDGIREVGMETESKVFAERKRI